MNYSIARADLIAEQIRQFASRHPHQLAGHHANVEFWLSEAREALQSLDGYSARFRRLRDSQVEWVLARHVRMHFHCRICGGLCEFGPQAPSPPTRLPHQEIEAAREAIRSAVVRLLVQFYHLGLMTESEIRKEAVLVGAPFETEDLELLK